MTATPAKPAAPAESPPLADLERQSQELKARIAEQRRRSAMPVNASLGDPAIDARNADGRNDLADEDEA
jgi:hypothetical protein